jgi:prepilin-type N-terminal cleavage/methylation domain-containing protein
MRRNESGFTLIELMVVISIVAVLVAAVSLGINVAMKQQQKTITQNRLNQIGGWIDQISSADNLGRAPRTSTLKLRGPGTPKKAVKYGETAGQPNSTNVGIETIFVAVAIPEFGGVTPPELDEQAYGNTDDDDMGGQVGKLPSLAMQEFVDAWGNPFVYFAAGDYKNVKDMEDYLLDDGQETVVTAAPMVNATTGAFKRPDTFQLFSMGPDGQPGTEDDIHYGF